MSKIISGWKVNYEDGKSIIYTENAYKDAIKQTQIFKIKTSEHWFDICDIVKNNPGLKIKILDSEKIEFLNNINIDKLSMIDGDVEYMLIKDNDINRSMLKILGAKESDFNEMKFNYEYLDLGCFAFEIVNYYDKDIGFIENYNN